MSARGATLVACLNEGATRVESSKVAIRSGSESMSYGDLLRGARAFAATLAGAGVGRGARVGLWMDKSPACVQAIVGTLLAGAAYVPIDPKAPWRRCRAIALDCEFAALVVDTPRLPVLGEFLEGQSTRLVFVDDRVAGEPGKPTLLPAGPRLVRFEEALRNEAVPLPEPSPADVAYILYTSGSTGTPKGVVHTHASGLAFVRWVQDTFHVTPEDVFSSHAPFHFDLSISDLFASLGTGARLQLVSSTEAMLAPYLVRAVAEWGITVWYSVPSILVQMLDRGNLGKKSFPDLRVLLFAGEVFPTPQLRRLRAALPGARLCNLFGPTETNVCTWWEVPAALPPGDAPIPIGRACEHMETFVLDDEGREVGEGVEGTLWARDGNVMRGYWNDAERTARTLRPDPRGRPGLAYCTGDRVRRSADGSYEFLGRRDHMVKTRGYRVDLGEVESALASHPELLEAVVVPLPDLTLGSRLVAVAVPRSGCAPEVAELRAHCRRLLPGYMVPEQIVLREELPRTSTGKADRTAIRGEFDANVLREGGA